LIVVAVAVCLAATAPPLDAFQKNWARFLLADVRAAGGWTTSFSGERTG